MQTPYNATHGITEDTQAVTYDNRNQREVTERLYIGMNVSEYTPFSDDVDTYGHDYVSVSDGILALMGV